MKKSPSPFGNLNPEIERIAALAVGGFKSVFARIQNPRRLIMYFAVMLIGLGASRFVNSIIMYSLSSQLQSVTPMTSILNPVQRPTAVAANYDLASIIDGVFFKRQTVEAAGPEAGNAPDIKNFSLIGTLEGDPSFARAVIRIAGDKEEPREYALGEKIGSAVLIAIGYEKIWVRLNGNKFKIEVGESMQDTQARPGGGGESVSKVISRQDINEKILGNPAAIYGGGAAFGPNLVDGKIDGFRLHRVPENHIFYTLGARSGDIIKSVNGYSLTNTSQMMELWNNIRTMPRVSVELIRDGKPMKFDFEIRN